MAHFYTAFEPTQRRISASEWFTRTTPLECVPRGVIARILVKDIPTFPVSRLTPEQFSALTVYQIPKISVDELLKLKPDHMRVLRKSQIQALTGEQVKTIFAHAHLIGSIFSQPIEYNTLHSWNTIGQFTAGQICQLAPGPQGEPAVHPDVPGSHFRPLVDTLYYLSGSEAAEHLVTLLSADQKNGLGYTSEDVLTMMMYG